MLVPLTVAAAMGRIATLQSDQRLSHLIAWVLAVVAGVLVVRQVSARRAKVGLVCYSVAVLAALWLIIDIAIGGSA